MRRLVIKFLEGEANLVGSRGLQVAAVEVEDSKLIFLVGGEIGRILQPDVAAAGEFGMVFTFQAADLVDGIIDTADDVELVKGDGSIRQLPGNAFNEGGRQVDTALGNGLRIAPMDL